MTTDAPRRPHGLSGMSGPAPVMFAPDCAALMERQLGEVAELDAPTEPNAEGFWGEPGSFLAMLRPYEVIEGTLVIPIKGSLLNDFPYAFFGWATGYEYIRAAVARGVADEGVARIVLDVDSPGGSTVGCFETGNDIFEARSAKPITAYVNWLCCSAGYALASAAEEIVAVSQAAVGSIGVYIAHTEVSKMVAAQGVKVTFVHAGERKVDGNPYEELPDRHREHLQKSVNRTYDTFVAAVARNRGIEESVVRGTEAAWFDVEDALPLGLIDRVDTKGDMLAALSAPADAEDDPTEPNDPEEEDDMSNDTPAAAAATEEQLAAARSEGMTAGATAERQRIAAILDSDEAKERPQSARVVAFDTDKDASAAVTMLGKMPVETAPEASPGKSSLEERMESSPTPTLGAEGGDDPAPDSPEAEAAAILADFKNARG